MKKIVLLSVLLFLACIPIFLGIFHPGFFLTDDGNWMVIRLSAFYEALRQGQFPIRFLPRLNNNYGYPVSDFLYPLFLYLGSFIHVFHVPFVFTVKLLFGISLITSAVGSFLWLKKRYNNLLAAIVGSLVYTLFPYHVWDITKRGSLGEVLALGIAPFLFLFIDTGNTIVSAITVSLIIVSHNTLALLFLFIAFLYAVIEKRFKKTISSFVLGVGVSAFFWMPALFDTQYTIFSHTVVSQLSQYFLSFDLYPLIGIISFFILLFSLTLVYKRISTEAVFFLVVAFLSISLTNKVSQPIWQFLPLGKYVQFPFRFLSLTALCMGFLAAYIVAVQKKYAVIFAGILLILLYVSSWQFFFSKTYQNYSDSYYSTNEDTTTVQNEYMPIGVKKPYISASHMELSGTSIEHLGSVVDKGSNMSFQLQTSQATQVTIGKVFFPGWVVTVDTMPEKIQTNEYGFISFRVPKGEHAIKASFGETSFRLITDAISLVTLLGMIGWFIWKKKGIFYV